MTTTHLDAQAVAQPGGIYESINNGLLQALRAYFANQQSERQGRRQLAQDERQGRRAQLAQALGLAERYGVGPGQADTGWMAPEDQALIARAQAAGDDRRNREAAMWQQRMDEAETRRLHAAADAAARWSDAQRRLGAGVISGEVSPDAAIAAGLDPAHVESLRLHGEQQRLARESDARAKLESDQLRADREAERHQWLAEEHQRRMAAPLPGTPKAGGGDAPKKAPTSQADLDRAFQNAQRRAQGLPPLPDPAKSGEPSAADLWGSLDELLRREVEGEQGDDDADLRSLAPPEAPAEPAAPMIRQEGDAVPADPLPAPAPRRPSYRTAGRAALSAWLAREGASVANGVRAGASARAHLPA